MLLPFSALINLALALGQLPVVEFELSQLANQVAESLRHPYSFSFREQDAWLSFRADLQLASEWPHPNFREPLLKLTQHSDPSIVLQAAGALMGYQDDGLRAPLEALRNDKRKYQVGCVSYALGTAIEELLASTWNTEHIVPTEDLLPISKEEFPGIQWPNHLTVPDAAKALRANTLSQRVQAATWLSSRELLMDAEPLIHCWPKLSDEQRCAVFDTLHELRIGGQRARLAVEWFWGQDNTLKYSDATRCRLLQRLAWYGSPQARPALLEIIRRDIDAAAEIEKAAEDVFGELPLVAALGAFHFVATDDDIDEALRWLSSDVSMVRRGAAAVLARRDAPRARQAVMDYLGKYPDEQGELHDLPWSVLQSRDWADPASKAYYTRALIELLRHRVDAVRDATLPWKNWNSIPEIIHTLQAINQITLGGDGVGLPSLTLHMGTVRTTLERWEAWLKHH